MTEIERELLNLHRQLAVNALSHHFLIHALLHSLDEKTLESMTILLQEQSANCEFDELTLEALESALAAVHGVRDDDNHPPPPSLHLIRGSKK
jgi:hypothetical protein